jgi:predicted Na+-dependent transporter
MAGLFRVGAAPGAPLMTRNIANRGFDMQLAAAYQVWGGLLTPVMLPVVVGAGLLYGVRIWIPPRDVLLQILEKQFVPLLVGRVLVYFLPAFAAKAQPGMNRLGNIVLTLGIIAMLWTMRETLKELLTWWLPVGALLLALGSVAAIWLLVPKADLLTKRTLAICNANRHIGLALLLSGQYLRLKGALPAVATYALVVPL